MFRQCPPLLSICLFFGLFCVAIAARGAPAEPAVEAGSNPAVAHPLERTDLEP